MTSLLTSIKRMERDLKPGQPHYLVKLWHTFSDWVVDTVTDNKLVTLYYKIMWLFRNIYFFRRHLYNQRPWDISYCNEIYADTIERMGKSTIEYGHFVGNVKAGRQALYAAKLLRQLDNDLTYEDPALKYYNNMSTWDWGVKLENGCRVMSFPITKPGMTSDYLHKLKKASYKRLKKEDISRRKFVFDYIAQKSQRWGD